MIKNWPDATSWEWQLWKCVWPLFIFPKAKWGCASLLASSERARESQMLRNLLRGI